MQPSVAAQGICALSMIPSFFYLQILSAALAKRWSKALSGKPRVCTRDRGSLNDLSYYDKVRYQFGNTL
jgi:hypothetical protein